MGKTAEGATTAEQLAVVDRVADSLTETRGALIPLLQQVQA